MIVTIIYTFILLYLSQFCSYLSYKKVKMVQHLVFHTTKSLRWLYNNEILCHIAWETLQEYSTSFAYAEL